MSRKSPQKLSPALKDYIWGGERLRTEFNKVGGPDRVAESWELSAHKDGQSTIACGEYASLTLSEYIKSQGADLLGTKCDKYAFFPILIKLIDAKNDLSVQVHPSDEYALEHEGEFGKTEMWYVIDADEGATLYYGFSRDVTREEFKKAIEDSTLTEILNKVEVKRGDTFFIPAGTVHAIGAGILICEIQQNSNTTYRIFDYNRRDKDGNTRPLHTAKALEVSTLIKAPALLRQTEGSVQKLAECKYFTAEKITATEYVQIEVSEESFASLMILSGEGTLFYGAEEMPFKKGESIFVPAQNTRLIARGAFEMIVTRVN